MSSLIIKFLYSQSSSHPLFEHVFVLLTSSLISVFIDKINVFCSSTLRQPFKCLMDACTPSKTPCQLYLLPAVVSIIFSILKKKKIGLNYTKLWKYTLRATWLFFFKKNNHISKIQTIRQNSLNSHQFLYVSKMYDKIVCAKKHIATAVPSETLSNLTAPHRSPDICLPFNLFSFTLRTSRYILSPCQTNLISKYSIIQLF